MLFAEEHVYATFDSLVARKVILYGPETVFYVQDGMFKVSQSQSAQICSPN